MLVILYKYQFWDIIQNNLTYKRLCITNITVTVLNLTKLVKRNIEIKRI